MKAPLALVLVACTAPLDPDAGEPGPPGERGPRGPAGASCSPPTTYVVIESGNGPAAAGGRVEVIALFSGTQGHDGKDSTIEEKIAGPLDGHQNGCIMVSESGGQSLNQWWGPELFGPLWRSY